MEEKSLALSFGNSLTEEVSGIVGDYAEIGLDALLEDGLFKDIPIVSTAIAVYRIGKSVRERHHIAKLISFMNEINKRIVDEEKRKQYREKFVSNEGFRNQELEYILILIDRYISSDKPAMLAKLYLAYLDGRILWQEFTMYAEVIDRFLLLDCRTLTTAAAQTTVHRNLGGESVLRLVALGLMAEKANNSRVEFENGEVVFYGDDINRISGKTKVYERTEFGEQLAAILRG